VCDAESFGFIREAARTELSSFDHDLRTNADGSVDVLFASSSCEVEGNVVSTAPGRRWVVAFRLYGPEAALTDGSWVLPDVGRLD
jgi:hypothetical protein